MSYYHGTSKRHARGILRHGLRDSTWVENAVIPGNTTRRRFGGALGHGTYITENWRVGLYFGPVLFRAELLPGTRLLPLNVPLDPAILDQLKRQFTHQIFTKNISQVLPRNKQLTLPQAIDLTRYHYREWTNSSFFTNSYYFHHQRLLSLRSLLIRYGFHGWGDSQDINGLCLFDSSRIQLREIVVALPTRRLMDACNDFERTDGPHASLSTMIQTMHQATTRAAQNTRQWFHQANLQLQQPTTLHP